MSGLPPLPSSPPVATPADDQTHYLNLVSYSLIACVAVQVWDYIILFPGEVQILRDKWSLVKCMYILNRIALFGHVITTMYWGFGSPPSCQVAFYFTEIFLMLAEASTSVIFTMRTKALVNHKKIIMYPIYVLNFLVIASFIAIIPPSRLSQFPVQPAPYASWCFNPSEPNWTELPFGLNVLFDSVIVVVTLIAVRRHQLTSKPRSGKISGVKLPDYLYVFVRDGLGYFVFSFIVNTIQFVWTLVVQNPIHRQLFFPQVTLVAFLMAPRVVINLKQSSKRRENGGTLFSSNSGSDSNHLPRPGAYGAYGQYGLQSHELKQMPRSVPGSQAGQWNEASNRVPIPVGNAQGTNPGYYHGRIPSDGITVHQYTMTNGGL